MGHPHIIRRAPTQGTATPIEVNMVEMDIAAEVAAETEPVVMAMGSWPGQPPIHVRPPARSVRIPRAGTDLDRISKSIILDLIVLAFSGSKLRALVGTDAFRSVLHERRTDMFPSAGVLVLQPVWDLLESQPGFIHDFAAAPMCRLKVLERRLQLDIVMPVALAALDDNACAERAVECFLTNEDVERMLAPPSTIAAKRVIESITIETEPAKPRRLGLAALAAVIGLAAAGISAHYTFTGGEHEVETGNFESVAALDVSTDIPFDEVRKSGQALMGTLSDGLWTRKPEAERKAQLEGAVTKVRALGATSLVVIDTDGRMAASVTLDGGTTVTFPGHITTTP